MGENYGHAIIESLLADVPVLITDRTPWRNLEAEGLGLDAVLGDKRTFVDYLTKIAEMDYAEYTEKFGGVAENAKRLVNIPQICESYLTLLS